MLRPKSGKGVHDSAEGCSVISGLLASQGPVGFCGGRSCNAREYCYAEGVASLMRKGSREEERKKVERLKADWQIDEWLLQEAIRTGQPKPMHRIKTKFSPTVCDLLVDIVDKYTKTG